MAACGTPINASPVDGDNVPKRCQAKWSEDPEGTPVTQKSESMRQIRRTIELERKEQKEPKQRPKNAIAPKVALNQEHARSDHPDYGRTSSLLSQLLILSSTSLGNGTAELDITNIDKNCLLTSTAPSFFEQTTLPVLQKTAREGYPKGRNNKWWMEIPAIRFQAWAWNDRTHAGA